MQATTYGVRKPGKLIPIPPNMLTETIPGAIYEIHIKCDKAPPPEKTIKVLTTELPKKAPIKIHWISVEGETIKMQIEGSPVSWSLIIALIPLIIMLVGVAVLLISIYQLFAHIPSYIWGLLIIGIVFVFILPRIAATITELYYGR